MVTHVGLERNAFIRWDMRSTVARRVAPSQIQTDWWWKTGGEDLVVFLVGSVALYLLSGWHQEGRASPTDTTSPAITRPNAIPNS